MGWWGGAFLTYKQSDISWQSLPSNSHRTPSIILVSEAQRLLIREGRICLSIIINWYMIVFPGFFPSRRCCRACISWYSPAARAWQQAALLSAVVAQYGAPAFTVHRVRGTQCESCSPGGRATTLPASAGDAQHENHVVSQRFVPSRGL